VEMSLLKRNIFHKRHSEGSINHHEEEEKLLINDDDPGRGSSCSSSDYSSDEDDLISSIKKEEHIKTSGSFDSFKGKERYPALKPPPTKGKGKIRKRPYHTKSESEIRNLVGQPMRGDYAVRVEPLETIIKNNLDIKRYNRQIVKERALKKRRERKKQNQAIPQTKEEQGEKEAESTTPPKKLFIPDPFQRPKKLKKKKIEPIYKVISGKTTLIMDFNFYIPEPETDFIVDRLLTRSITDKDGHVFKLWQETRITPDEIGELSTEFRKRCGYKEAFQVVSRTYSFALASSAHKKVRKEMFKVWSSKTLEITAKGMEVLFPQSRARICALQGKRDGSGQEKIWREVQVSSIKIIICPMGAGILTVDIDWLPDGQGIGCTGSTLLLSELRTWLFLSQFRNPIETVLEGWVFPGAEIDDSYTQEDMSCDAKSTWFYYHAKQLGSLAQAIYANNPISLAELSNWLVHLPEEDPNDPPLRINRGSRCHHHSVIVIDRKPKKEILKEYIYHLRRAFGQINRPPPKRMKKGVKGTDKVLAERKNRYVGMSREGVVAISWPDNKGENRADDFNLLYWPNQFLGIYLFIALQAHIEKCVLATLFTLSAELAGSIRLENKLAFQDIELFRYQFRELATKMVQFTVSMGSDDCGGRYEYSNFFYSLRRVFRIPKLKDEIREILDDVLQLVESGYSEEQKKNKRRGVKNRKDEGR